MNLYKKVYRVIGCMVLIIGLLLFPFISMSVKGGYSKEIKPYLVYIINVLATVISYFLFAYNGCILSVAQRNDLASIIRIIVMLAQYIIQGIILLE